MRLESFPPISNKSSKIVLLGTMPGEKSFQVGEYFANKSNQFWKIMFVLLKQEFLDEYSIRQNLLLESGIALWDVLKACIREGSLDKGIRQEVPNDFLAFYKQHPQIEHVFFLSQKAQEAYSKHVIAPVKTFHLLPSPSGANTRKSLSQKVEEWKEILKFI